MAKTKENKTENLRQLSVEELHGRLTSARKILFELNLKRSEQKNPLKIKWARHDVARLMTLINEKSTGGPVEKNK